MAATNGGNIVGIVDELRAELRRYAETAAWWEAVTTTANEEGRAETYQECESFSRRLEDHAHNMADLLGQFFKEVDGVDPLNEPADPLGHPDPAHSELPERDDDYTPEAINRAEDEVLPPSHVFGMWTEYELGQDDAPKQ